MPALQSLLSSPYFRDGLRTSTAAIINTAVTAILTGYADKIDGNVLYVLKTVPIHAILTPHTPRTVSTAGISEIPNPLRYPAIFSYSMEKVYAEKIQMSLVYPLATMLAWSFLYQNETVNLNKRPVSLETGFTGRLSCRNQSSWAFITCLMRVYSSKPYMDKSLP
jgi:hypothetical protein